MRSCHSSKWMTALGLVGMLACSAGLVPGLVALAQFTGAHSASVSDSIPSGQMPTETTWPKFLELVRQHSLAYSSALPDFTCNQGDDSLQRSLLD